MEHIISFLPVRDVVALGQTCHYFREVCDTEGVWRRICRRLSPRLREQGSGVRPWKRAAILNYTKGLYFQAFGGRRRCLSKSVAPLLAHGYRRFLPTKDHVFILDYVGTLFFFKNALVSSTLGQIQWKRACRYVVLCRGAKDVSSRTLAAQKPPLLREASLEVSSQTRNWKTSPHFPALHPRSSPPTGSTCPSLIPLQGRRSQTPSSFPTVCLGPKM